MKLFLNAALKCFLHYSLTDNITQLAYLLFCNTSSSAQREEVRKKREEAAAKKK